jgi:hypothetical protein
MSEVEGKSHELEHVNWNLVRYYTMLARQCIKDDALASGDLMGRVKMAERFLLQAMQQIESCMTGRVRIALWSSYASAGLWDQALVTRLVRLGFEMGGML